MKRPLFSSGLHMSDGWLSFFGNDFHAVEPPCVMYTRVAKNKGTAIKQIASF